MEKPELPDILVWGYGTMTSAMVAGWLASGIPPSKFTVYNPRPKDVPHGVTFVSTPPAHQYPYVLLGFKPHMLADIAADMQEVVGPRTCVMSVLAGIGADPLAAAFPAAGAVARFMPNLASAVNKSPNILHITGGTSSDRDTISDLAERLGSAEWLEDEAQFDLATALAGSGPGFVYRFIDAIAMAAGELGLPPEQAQRLATRMVDGAATLAARSEAPPSVLAQRVASPGGMTQAGLDVLDDDEALRVLLRRTLRATAQRGGELAVHAKPDG